jgi:hypothetical protein
VQVSCRRRTFSFLVAKRGADGAQPLFPYVLQDEPTESINPKRAKPNVETEINEEDSDEGSIASSEPPEEVYVSDSLAEASKSRWGIFTFHYKAKCFASCMPVPIELVFERSMRPCRFCVPDWQKHPLYLKHLARKNAARQRSVSRRPSSSRSHSKAGKPKSDRVRVKKEREAMRDIEEEAEQTLVEPSSCSSSDGDLSEPMEPSSDLSSSSQTLSSGRDTSSFYNNGSTCATAHSEAISWRSLSPNAIFDPFMFEAYGWIGRVEEIL